MFSIVLLHPFTAKAVGLTENDFLHSHSKPHESALRGIQNDNLLIKIDYFSNSFFLKKFQRNGIEKRFWPLSFLSLLKKKKWRNETSTFHYKATLIKPADLTIINMSGHGSDYVFRLAKILLAKNKTYIAMIGGLAMSYEGEALLYYKQAHHIIVHTERQKIELKSHSGFENLDIRVLPLGINTSDSTPKIRADSELKGKLLFVGRFTRLKQIELAVGALKFIIQQGYSEAKLTLIGPKSDNVYYLEILELIKNLKLENNIEILNALPNEMLIEYYQKAEIFLLPSLHESFGMVITEAMCCGLPVIALKGSGGPDEIITSGNNGLLTSKDQFSNSVLSILTNKNNYNSLSLNARATIVANYGIENTISILRQSIEDALKSKV